MKKLLHHGKKKEVIREESSDQKNSILKTYHGQSDHYLVDYERPLDPSEAKHFCSNFKIVKIQQSKKKDIEVA